MRQVVGLTRYRIYLMCRFLFSFSFLFGALGCAFPVDTGMHDLSALVLQSSQTLQLVGFVISTNQTEGTHTGFLDAEIHAEPQLLVLVEQISRMKFHLFLQA